jgi:hypothetical protein
LKKAAQNLLEQRRKSAGIGAAVAAECRISAIIPFVGFVLLVVQKPLEQKGLKATK